MKLYVMGHTLVTVDIWLDTQSANIRFVCLFVCLFDIFFLTSQLTAFVFINFYETSTQYLDGMVYHPSK